MITIAKNILNKKVIFFLCSICSAFLLQAQTFITSDSVSGKWLAASSPYLITRDLLIPEGATLIIEPGTEIQFAGYYALRVEGKIIAKGKKDEGIIFRYADSSMIDLCNGLCDTNAPMIDGWKGIRFLENRSENDTSSLVYCSVSGAKAITGTSEDCTGGAFSIRGKGQVIVKNCRIFNNQALMGGAMFCENSNPIIDGNLIEDNKIYSYGGAFFIFNSSPVIKSNLIRRNTSPEFGGAFYIDQSECFFINNTIAENTARFGGAISAVNTTIFIINNTIVNNSAQVNGGGIHCMPSSPYILNSILWGNTCGKKGKQIYLYEQSYPEITYSTIQGGLPAIEMFSDTMNLVKQYAHNIEEDPIFIVNDTAYFSLDKESPCIDAGFNNDTLITEVLDMNGNPRIINNTIDVGAQEFNGIKTGIEAESWNETEKPKNNKELVIYPIPNLGRFTIEINAIANDVTHLSILNVEGQLLHSQSICIEESADNLLLDLDIPHGLYIVELKNSKGYILKKGKIIVE